MDEHVDLVDGAARRTVELAVDRPLGLRVHAGRIDEQDLRAGPRGDAEDAMAGGLRLGADDADAEADERVLQGRLADVRPPQQRDEAAAMG